MSDVQTAEQLWVKAHELVKAGQLAHAVRDLARCYEILKAAQDPRLSQVHRRWIEVHQVYLRRSQKAKQAKASAAQANPDSSAAETAPVDHEAAQALAESESAAASVDSVAVAADPMTVDAPAHVPDSQPAEPEVVQESEPSGASPELYADAVDAPQSAPSTAAANSSDMVAEERSWAAEEPESDEIAVAGAGDFGEETISEPGPEFDFQSEKDQDAGLAADAEVITVTGGASSEASENLYSQAIAEENAVVPESAAHASWDEEGSEADASSSAAMSDAFSEPTAVAEPGAGFAGASVDISAESGAMPVGDAQDDNGEMLTAALSAAPALEMSVDAQEASPLPIDVAASQPVPATEPVSSYAAHLENHAMNAATQDASFSLQSEGAYVEAFSAEAEAHVVSAASESDDVAFLEALLHRVESRRRHVGVSS